MAKLYGRDVSRRELLRRVGDVGQVAGVRRCVLSEGRWQGVEAVDVYTGTGFSFTVLPSRALDISAAWYKGMALAWRSPTGDVHPAYYEPEGLGWLRSFFGGLVATCGLANAGAPCVDQGQSLGLHGRIGNTPAYAVLADGEWQGDEYAMAVRGKVRQSAVFGEDLLLTRCISAKLGESRLVIEDVVENLAWEPSPLQLLYHCNLGYPLVDEGSRMLLSTAGAVPRDAEAEQGKEAYAACQAPAAGYKEKVYYHDLSPSSDGNVAVALVNDRLGLGVYIRYRKDELPRFTEWKMMGEGTYVVGLEPANCQVEGRNKDRERGILQFIQPGEVRRFRLEIGVLDGKDEIRAVEQEVEFAKRP